MDSMIAWVLSLSFLFMFLTTADTPWIVLSLVWLAMAVIIPDRRR